MNDGEPQIDTVTIWYLIIGVLLILMGLSGSVLKRLPLSPAMLSATSWRRRANSSWGISDMVIKDSVDTSRSSLHEEFMIRGLA